MIELSIPAVLGMVVVGLYNMMDSIFVGQMVGDVQMGAISVSYPLTLINAGSAAMLGVGSASVCNHFLPVCPGCNYAVVFQEKKSSCEDWAHPH